MKGLLILYGSPASGKSTLAEYLRTHLTQDIKELDEEVLKENGGIWPEPSEYRNSAIVPRVLERVSHQRSGIFLTSSINPSFMKAVREVGGMVVLLQVPEDVLMKRNKTRENVAYGAQEIRHNLEDQDRFRDAIGYDFVLDASGPVEQIAEEVKRIMDNVR